MKCRPISFQRITDQSVPNKDQRQHFLRALLSNAQGLGHPETDPLWLNCVFQCLVPFVSQWIRLYCVNGKLNCTKMHVLYELEGGGTLG